MFSRKAKRARDFLSASDVDDFILALSESPRSPTRVTANKIPVDDFKKSRERVAETCLRRNSSAWLYQDTTGNFRSCFSTGVVGERDVLHHRRPGTPRVSLASSSRRSFALPREGAIPSDLGCFIIHAPSSQTEICLWFPPLLLATCRSVLKSALFYLRDSQ